MTGRFTRLALLAATISVSVVLLADVLFEAIAGNRRAVAHRQQQATMVAAAVLGSTDRDTVRRIIARAPASRMGALAVHLPGGLPVGNSGAARQDVRTVMRSGNDGVSKRDGDRFSLTAVALDDGRTAVVEMRMPAGTSPTQLAVRLTVLLIIGMAGVGLATAAVRLRTRPDVTAARRLVADAGSLEPGAPPVMLDPRAPGELVEIGKSLTNIASRWSRLRTDERKLVADVSHRLRTPLTALRLDAESIGDTPVGDRIRCAVAALESELADVITDCGDGRHSAHGRCDLSAVVSERVAFWAALAEDQGRRGEFHGTDTSALVALPEETARDVLDALLVNVFQHTPPPTPFTVALVEHAGWITLVVDDGGEGIADPEAALRRGASGGDSTGLGLDIARKSAERSGGSIHIERSALGGARVRLRFPGPGGSTARREAPKAWRLWRGARSAR